MPLDNVGNKFDLTIETDTPKRLGIIPVPQDVVAAYKKAYRVAWLKMKPGDYAARWRTVKYNPKTRTLEEFLVCPVNSARIIENSGAPSALIALAQQVQAEHPTAEFSVDYFITDPVLNVKINGEKVCLGIWDKGLEAIATTY